jgi:hypothetical protein
MLVSRDEQSVLVVSYKDVKACVASAFGYASLRSIDLPLFAHGSVFDFPRELSQR